MGGQANCLHNTTDYSALHGWSCCECGEYFDDYQHYEILIARRDRRIAELEETLNPYENNYEICDCCRCLTPDPIDAGGHTQCKSCTRIAELKAELANKKELCAADRFHHFGAG